MTLEEIKNYIKIDFNDDDELLEEIIEVSGLYIDEMVGEGYKANEKGLKLANLLQKKISSDMYENRSAITTNLNRDRIADGILTRLAMYNEVV